MKLFLRHKLLIVGVIVAAAATAGGAYAATQSSSNRRQAYLNDVARRLNVSPSKLESALKGALIDRLNAMVKAGKLTQAQASKIESRINQGGRFPFFFGAIGAFGHGRLHLGLRGAGPNSPLHAAASYLGLSDAQLISALRSGKSLAQVAQSHGKSVSGLEQAIISAEKSRLDKLVSAGLVTSAQEQKLLSRLSTKIDRLVNRTGVGQHLRLRQGPMMPPPPGPATGPGGPAASPPPPAA